MKKIILMIFLPVAMFALSSKDLAISINLAGKQRMLTQKMTKEALLIKAKIDIQDNIKKLKKSRDLFDKTVKGLQHGDKSLKLKRCNNKKVQQQLKIVYQLWKEFDANIEKVIQSKATSKTYVNLQKLNIPLLKQMNKAVELYVKQSKKGVVQRQQAVNLCGKERMLTQKMAKDLMLVVNKMDVKKSKKEFKKTSALFEKILKGLQHGDKSLGLQGTKLPKIQKELKVGEKLYKSIKRKFKLSLKNKKIAKDSVKRLDKLLLQMDKTVTLFAKSVKKEKQVFALNAILNSYMHKKNIKNNIINLSGKQRMLTQKISKLVLMVYIAENSSMIKNKLVKDTSSYLKKDIVKYKKRLINATKLYDKTLKGFINGDNSLNLPATKDKKIISFVGKLRKKWEIFNDNVQKIISSKGSKQEALKYIFSNNEELLSLSNELVQKFKKQGGKANFLEKDRLNIVDIAGRERMLTQKMTKEKLFTLLGIDAKENEKKLQKTIKLFDSSLNALINGDDKLKIVKPSNKKIKKQLNRVALIWQKLKTIYKKRDLKKHELIEIIDKNPKLLAQMNKAVVLSAEVVEY